MSTDYRGNPATNLDIVMNCDGCWERQKHTIGDLINIVLLPIEDPDTTKGEAKQKLNAWGLTFANATGCTKCKQVSFYIHDLVCTNFPVFSS